jgi:hypothetical protein
MKDNKNITRESNLDLTAEERQSTADMFFL